MSQDTIRLTRSFYARETATVARELLGKRLIRRVGDEYRIGRIVEVEAYLGPRDLAAHSAKGRTPRTEVMFGPPGYAYVYLIYGIHHCMNIVTGIPGTGAAVLLRAVEPIANLTLRTQGPGLLCKAFGIDRSCNAHDLLSDDFHCAEDLTVLRAQIAARPRIGVDYAGSWARRLLRFYLKGNTYVSKP